MTVILRYDGKYNWIPGDSRQWTILNHYKTQEGRDLCGASFLMPGLKRIGILKGA